MLFYIIKKVVKILSVLIFMFVQEK